MAAPKGNKFGLGFGRPQKEIHWDTFEELCKIQCTQSEIASVLKVSVDTLIDKVEKKYEDRFSSVYKMLSEDGKASLRRTQLKLCQRNASMAIWLGKQYLGQKDTEQPIAVTSEAFDKYSEMMQRLADIQEKAKETREASLLSPDV